MIVRDYWRLSHPDAPMAASYGPLASCEEWRNRRPIPGRTPESYVLERFPCCKCCGETLLIETIADAPPEREWRCPKHRGRNPCAIEGCTRTTEAPEGPVYGDDQWLCSTHWRRLVPPRSARRRAYHAFFRKAKRMGWSGPLRRQFYRFWDTLVSNARHKAQEGTLDRGAIDRLFGFGDES